MNSLGVILSILLISLVVVLLLYRTSKIEEQARVEAYTSVADVVEKVKEQMITLVKGEYKIGLSTEDFNREFRRRAEISKALTDCMLGKELAKKRVKELIKNYIQELVPQRKVSELLGLSEGLEPTEQVKFELIMQKYKLKYGKDALAEWLSRKDLARERYTEAGDPEAYHITKEEFIELYEEEQFELDESEQRELLATLVYQCYKGFGIVDTIMEMNINGINLGVSGSILKAEADIEGTGGIGATKSVWVFYKGKYIHFRFLDFGTATAIQKVVQMTVRYQSQGALTEKRGFMITTMQDQSRVLAVRPTGAEYWGVFIRKFALAELTPEYLIDKPGTKRADLVINLLKHLVRGEQTFAVTGRQGSGKTTLMTALVRYIDARLTIRVLELAPELYLRELYPKRSIMSFQETTHVSATEWQDAAKKSDGAVSLVGEVATDPIAAQMIQMGMTASKFTIFSHHANKAADLVYTLRNSLANACGFTQAVAEKQVLDVVGFDVHMEVTAEGKRYIERVTEIIARPEKEAYTELDKDNLEYSKAQVEKEYYERVTDRIAFTSQDILRYDLETDTYEALNRPTREKEARMRSVLGKKWRAEYDEWVIQEFGRREEGEDKSAEVVEERKRKEKLTEVLIPLGREEGTIIGQTVVSIDEEEEEEEEEELDLKIVTLGDQGLRA